METENQSSFILPMPQDFPSGIADEDRLPPAFGDISPCPQGWTFVVQLRKLSVSEFSGLPFGSSSLSQISVSVFVCKTTPPPT